MADRRRRKSLSIFWPPKIDVSLPESSLSPTSPLKMFLDTDGDQNAPTHASPQIRPKTLQKTSRASSKNSVFGSLRSLRSLEDQEKLARSDSKGSSQSEEELGKARYNYGSVVLHHGEVQTTGGVFRKKTQFLVLTESHLVRFKSQSKAAEVFPTLPATLSKTNPNRASASSIGSFHDVQWTANVDSTSGIALDQVVACYKSEYGRPHFTIEVSYLDSHTNKASSIQIQLGEPREAELWLTAIQRASSKARTNNEAGLPSAALEYVARALERHRDYDPEHFEVYKVVQRAPSRAAGRSSSDDLSKLNTNICYFAIGINKVHLLPLPRNSNRSSSSSLLDLDVPMVFGIVNLTSIKLQSGDDLFQVVFRSPLCTPFTAYLASSQASEIALALRNASEYLRPEWTRQPLDFNVPIEVENQICAKNYPQEDHACFDRTLIAYCAAFDVDTSNIVYTINYECEDAPCFGLLPRPGQPYSNMELLAVFRALRYNESFTTISFANIDLTPLRHLFDVYLPDLDSLCTRSGALLNLLAHDEQPVLIQELRAIALKSRRLRRLDFSNCVLSSPTSTAIAMSCGVPEALVPLCKKSLTNVDWIILNGIRLTDSDLDYLVDAASERTCHFRALEIGDCGLAVHDVDVLLSTLATQETTMEVINIAGVQGRFSPELFQRQIGYFPHIRRLILTRVQRTAGLKPLIAPETLLAWRLETFHFGQTSMNEQTVDSISAYLASPKSESLRELHLDQCGLTGKDLAIFFRSMAREHGHARDMHLSANENRLRVGCSMLFQCIEQNFGPTQLSMRMTEFEKENQFRELIQALTVNTTLRKLDISKASLPYDAGDETCEAIKEMFAKNQTLEELDISGEHAHLDSARFGIGLNLALTGLKSNKVLSVLKIEHQNLGLQGANTLAEVLEVNQSLIEIHCAYNDINLQSLAVLVNALQKNTTLLYMPALEHDRAKSMEKVRRELFSMERPALAGAAPRTPERVSTIKRALTGTGMTGYKAQNRLSLRHSSTMPHSVAAPATYTEQDVASAMRALEDKWDAQIARMQRYLTRNFHLAQGLDWHEEQPDGAGGEGGEADSQGGRPGSADSLSKLLEAAGIERTPTMKNKIGASSAAGGGGVAAPSATGDGDSDGSASVVGVVGERLLELSFVDEKMLGDFAGKMPVTFTLPDD